jgi:hypothetical protein
MIAAVKAPNNNKLERVLFETVMLQAGRIRWECHELARTSSMLRAF